MSVDFITDIRTKVKCQDSSKLLQNMKLPFSGAISTILKPHMGNARLLCQHPTFLISLYYTYFYGFLGFLLSANHLRLHLGETPSDAETKESELANFMMVHDLKVIATSMGLVQYACLVLGCFTENPALFLPHLAGQLLLVAVEILNVLVLLAQVNMKSLCRLPYKIPAIALMTFNWLQEFCVFRKYLCICDL